MMTATAVPTLADHVRQIVDAAPPLTESQKADLRVLLADRLTDLLQRHGITASAAMDG